MNTTYRTWVEISRTAFNNNYKQFRRFLKPTCRLMAVVKSNAYGHGLREFSLLADSLGVDWFGVDSVVEAESLRKAGIQKPILVLGYTLPEKVSDALRNNVSLTIADIETLKKLPNVKREKKLNIHIKIDSGMHRQGLFVSEIPKAIRLLKSKKKFVNVGGVYTHFSSAKNPTSPSATFKQMRVFQKAIGIFVAAGFSKLLKHAAATSGAILFPQSHYDMARIGIGLYGLWPSQEIREKYEKVIALQPVLSWKTVVGQIKRLPKGSGIGYDLTETVKRPSTTALLSIGYWHGLPRALSSIGNVLIRGKQAKILGRVSMDMTTVDVTKIKNIRIGDVAVLIGKNRSMEILADDLANQSGTTNYEIVTRLNPLMKRIVTA